MSWIRRAWKRFVGVLGSYGLACILFILLGVLTFLGTLEQANHSLHEVRTRYFDSLFFTSDLLPFVPLPGAYLLLTVLFLNLLVGGLMRMRRCWSRAGILVTHIGIVVLLLSGIVEYHSSNKGYMTLFEGQSSDEFQSYYEWEVTITEPLPEGRERVHVIPHNRFAGLKRGERATFSADGLPFTVELRNFLENCRPRRVAVNPHGGMHGPAPTRAPDGIDGFGLEPLPKSMESERDIAGLTVALGDQNGMTREAILWGVQQAPYSTWIDGRAWAVDLRKRRWQLPFRLSLKKFTRELHPRTGMASSFSSDVTKAEDGTIQDIHISMNAPMREGGYTFYQSGWGPQNAPEGAKLFSTFSVVENPADRWPLYACIVIGLGLLAHFLAKLFRHIGVESRRRA